MWCACDRRLSQLAILSKEEVRFSPNQVYGHGYDKNFVAVLNQVTFKSRPLRCFVRRMNRLSSTVYVTHTTWLKGNRQLVSRKRQFVSRSSYKLFKTISQCSAWLTFYSRCLVLLCFRYLLTSLSQKDATILRRDIIAKNRKAKGRDCSLSRVVFLSLSLHSFLCLFSISQSN